MLTICSLSRRRDGQRDSVTPPPPAWQTTVSPGPSRCLWLAWPPAVLTACALTGSVPPLGCRDAAAAPQSGILRRACSGTEPSPGRSSDPGNGDVPRGSGKQGKGSSLGSQSSYVSQLYGPDRARRLSSGRGWMVCVLGSVAAAGPCC